MLIRIEIKQSQTVYPKILMIIEFDIIKLPSRRTKIAPLTDRRVKIIHEIVSFMKIIKMYGWELMFRDLVEKVQY